MRRAPWYEQWAFNAASPAISLFSWVSYRTEDVWKHYFYLVGVAKRNEQLAQETDQLRQQLVQFEEWKQENARLGRLLDLQRELALPVVAAKVVAYDPQTEFKTIIINKGAKHQIKPDMPVVSTAGLVGKVGPVFSDHAIILLITDPAMNVDVFDQRSRVRGILVGVAKNVSLRPGLFLSRLEYVTQTSDIQKGDLLITSGLDQLFPKGIAVGAIHKITNNPFGIFADAEVVPMVDFSQIEEVLVLLKP